MKSTFASITRLKLNAPMSRYSENNETKNVNPFNPLIIRVISNVKLDFFGQLHITHKFLFELYTQA